MIFQSVVAAKPIQVAIHPVVVIRKGENRVIQLLIGGNFRAGSIGRSQQKCVCRIERHLDNLFIVCHQRFREVADALIQSVFGNVDGRRRLTGIELATLGIRQHRNAFVYQIIKETRK